MKKINYFIIGLLILGVVFVSGNSFAQFGRPGVPGPVNLYGHPLESARDTCVASAMISSILRTPQGGYLAEISNLVIDPKDGRVPDIILTRFQGMGTTEVVIPFSTVSRTGETIFLYNAPEEVYPFSGELPYRSWGFNLYSKQKPTGSLMASKLIGAIVRTSKGEDLGRIDDLLIDHRNMHVAHLVVLGMEGKLVTVPFSALSGSGKDGFILKITRQELKAAPVFTPPEV